MELLVPKERLKRLEEMPVEAPAPIEGVHVKPAGQLTGWVIVVIGAAILTIVVVAAPKAKLTVMVLALFILTVQELVVMEVQPFHEAMCEPA